MRFGMWPKSGEYKKNPLQVIKLQGIIERDERSTCATFK
jgi:dUTPase